MRRTGIEIAGAEHVATARFNVRSGDVESVWPQPCLRSAVLRERQAACQTDGKIKTSVPFIEPPTLWTANGGIPGLRAILHRTTQRATRSSIFFVALRAC